MNSYLLAVHKAIRLTQNRFNTLNKHFYGDWQAVWHASDADLFAAKLDSRARQKWNINRAETSPAQIEEALGKCSATAISVDQKEYPIALANIPDAPAILFMRGHMDETNFPAVAVVGSRRLTAYGKRAIDTLVRPIARGGTCIVSGLAMGADAVAHQIALDENAKTIAVLGCGIDQITPRSSVRLGLNILEAGGAILSEYFPGTAARPEHFPARNRIVAGLSKGIIVGAAQLASGSLITARLGVEQGKEVFAVPGDIFSPGHAGTNELILKGMAHPALSAEQILEMLALHQTKPQAAQLQTQLPMTDLERDIMTAFGVEPQRHINEILRACAQHPGPVVSAHVSMLELKGALRHMGDQMYARQV